MTAGCPPTSPLPPLPSPWASTRALLGYTPSTPPQLCSCHIPSLGSRLHFHPALAARINTACPSVHSHGAREPTSLDHSLGFGTARQRTACRCVWTAALDRPGDVSPRTTLTCVGWFSWTETSHSTCPFFFLNVSCPISQASPRRKGALLAHILH